MLPEHVWANSTAVRFNAPRSPCSGEECAYGVDLASAEKTFRILRDIRDARADGCGLQDDPYAELRDTYGSNLRELQQRIRTELGSRRLQLTGGL